MKLTGLPPAAKPGDQQYHSEHAQYGDGNFKTRGVATPHCRWQKENQQRVKKQEHPANDHQTGALLGSLFAIGHEWPP